jgi:hypothetical protein
MAAFVEQSVAFIRLIADYLICNILVNCGVFPQAWILASVDVLKTKKAIIADGLSVCKML